MKNYLTALLLFAALTLFAGFHVAADRQIDSLSRQVDSLRAQVEVLQADTEDIMAVQGWHSARMDDISQRGRGQ